LSFKPEIYFLASKLATFRLRRAPCSPYPFYNTWTKLDNIGYC